MTETRKQAPLFLNNFTECYIHTLFFLLLYCVISNTLPLDFPAQINLEINCLNS